MCFHRAHVMLYTSINPNPNPNPNPTPYPTLIQNPMMTHTLTFCCGGDYFWSSCRWSKCSVTVFLRLTFSGAGSDESFQYPWSFCCFVLYCFISSSLRGSFPLNQGELKSIYELHRDEKNMKPPEARRNTSLSTNVM